ncbi:Cytochrome P450 76A2 [Morella rubra]|uniref:Cytochrome P450 76A2 n=1 Tax=Morella rubra TaxID=262757 RepID=A0A6A1W7X2_9ROSI|nr:Cytochrome P450 76A2 [Morella rubra]
MEYEALGLILVTLLWVAWLMIAERRRRRAKEQGQLPPGPRPWPVVGNLFKLDPAVPHKTFADLARKHGPIITLWLGSMRIVVVSSSEAARDMFKNHDVVLAGRKMREAMKGDLGTEGSLVMSSYGGHWRTLRRLSTSKFFVTSRLEAMRGVRGKCIDDMLHHIEEASASGTKAIDVSRFLFLSMFNLVGNMMFSKDLLDPKAETGDDFFYNVSKVTELGAKPNVADFFPILSWLDPQGLRRKTQFHLERAFEIAGGFMRERLEGKENGHNEVDRKDYLDMLLEFRGDGVEEPSRFSSKGINIAVLAGQMISCRSLATNWRLILIKKSATGMVCVGSDCKFVGKRYFPTLVVRGGSLVSSSLPWPLSSSFILSGDVWSRERHNLKYNVWAISELLHNPETLTKVQAELRSVISPTKKLEEKDFENLPYLIAVVKETLRLHPPLPVLVPHVSMDSCNMRGYYIPKDTQILVNVWAIGRDPNTWDEPLVFKPERFLQPNMADFRGQHFEFLPFGSGRRMCPAMPLASRVLPLALGSLLHSFDWILADGLKPEDMDMTERMGITLRKAVSLKAIPRPYKGNHVGK